jgi:hypothetical protein
MVLSPGLYGPVDQDQAVRSLLHAIDAGSSFVDTSDGYGVDAHNERLIGAAIASRRDNVGSPPSSAIACHPASNAILSRSRTAHSR